MYNLFIAGIDRHQQLRKMQRLDYEVIGASSDGLDSDLNFLIGRNKDNRSLMTQAFHTLGELNP